MALIFVGVVLGIVKGRRWLLLAAVGLIWFVVLGA